MSNQNTRPRRSRGTYPRRQARLANKQHPCQTAIPESRTLKLARDKMTLPMAERLKTTDS
ncbi:hypothetical protein WG66_014065 [Moniliophthora roreri]|nr:hypothetical protein WG66_014065 [Moniliophthora roreri]